MSACGFRANFSPFLRLTATTVPSARNLFFSLFLLILGKSAAKSGAREVYGKLTKMYGVCSIEKAADII
jgi:hypothetical protein